MGSAASLRSRNRGVSQPGLVLASTGETLCSQADLAVGRIQSLMLVGLIHLEASPQLKTTRDPQNPAPLPPTRQ